MGGEQAATVLATITKDQRAREGKEVTIGINHPVCATESQIRGCRAAGRTVNIIKAPPHLYKDKTASVSSVGAVEHCSRHTGLIKLCQVRC